MRERRMAAANPGTAGHAAAPESKKRELLAWM